MDQVREILDKLLADNGFAERVEALARMEISNAIGNDDLKPFNKYLREYLRHIDGIALITIVKQYLAALGFNYTLEVLMAETGTLLSDDDDVVAIVNAMEQLPTVSENEGPIDGFVIYNAEEISEPDPDALDRLKRRLGVSEFDECVRGAGADHQLMRQTNHESFNLRRQHQNNRGRRARSLGCEPATGWTDDDDSGFNSPQRMHLSENRMDDLKQALNYDEDVELRLITMGDSILLEPMASDDFVVPTEVSINWFEDERQDIEQARDRQRCWQMDLPDINWLPGEQEAIRMEDQDWPDINWLPGEKEQIIAEARNRDRFGVWPDIEWLPGEKEDIELDYEGCNWIPGQDNSPVRIMPRLKGMNCDPKYLARHRPAMRNWTLPERQTWAPEPMGDLNPMERTPLRGRINTDRFIVRS